MRLCLFILLFVFASTGQSAVYSLATGEFPPFTGEKLNSQGLATKIIEHTLQKMGHQARIDFLPWKRGYKQTLAGKYFGTFAYSKNKERQIEWHYSAALYQLKEVFFSQKKQAFSFETENDLKGLVVCKPIGYNLFGLKKLIASELVSIQRPLDMKQCFAMLKKGRVDLVMTNMAAGLKVLDDAGQDRKLFNVSDKAFVDIGHHLIVPRVRQGGKEFIKVFDQSLKEIREAGLIDKYIREFTQ